MKITLLADDRVRYELSTGPLTIEAPSAETSYSPFHMLASSLAVCTHSVLASWAQQAKLDVGDLAIEIGWTFAEQPHRVGAMAVELIWPSLPASRRAAAHRVADMCTVHRTLQQPPEMSLVVRGDDAGRAPSTDTPTGTGALSAPRPSEAA